MNYCAFVQGDGAETVHRPYHDLEYGYPTTDDRIAFGRLILEINQAGLSWETILKRKDKFEDSYSGFDIATIAAYGETDIDRLLNDPGVIRNRMKVAAAIHNAQRVVQIAAEHGSFVAWLDSHAGKTLPQWIKLMKADFKFVGGEICNEFLMSLGYLPGAHDRSCPVFAQVEKCSPKWLEHPHLVEAFDSVPV